MCLLCSFKQKKQLQYFIPIISFKCNQNQCHDCRQYSANVTSFSGMNQCKMFCIHLQVKVLRTNRNFSFCAFLSTVSHNSVRWRSCYDMYTYYYWKCSQSYMKNVVRNEVLYRSYHKWRNEPWKKSVSDDNQLIQKDEQL